MPDDSAKPTDSGRTMPGQTSQPGATPDNPNADQGDVQTERGREAMERDAERTQGQEGSEGKDKSKDAKE